eukprot:TRINITY_DN73586_c0_g1_i1.p1 TRINITY_DN73586_c0_g1~~TRINITY_DN73586_c0_g1_i1.p1  ORF type:complete len:474 (+),score=91.96 TRINITY_DN73586_c0_g1_i1:113-1423(+)
MSPLGSSEATTTPPVFERNSSRPTVWRASTWPARELKDITCKFDDCETETAYGSEQSSVDRFPTGSTLEYLGSVGVVTSATPRVDLQLEELRLHQAFDPFRHDALLEASLPSPSHFCITACGSAPAPAGFRMAIFDSKMWLAVGFSFVNGWIDAISLKRYQAFATMMVGNMLLLGSSMAERLTRRSHPEQEMRAAGPLFYMSILLAFVSGVTVYRMLEKKRGWSSRTVAPVVVLWIVAHEVIEYFIERTEYAPPSRWNALRLAPIFGAQDAVTVKGGLATLPWCTTGHVVTIGSTLADTLTGGASVEDRRKCAVALAMMASMILGAVAGMAFDAMFDNIEWEYSVAAPVLATFFLIHDRMFPPKPQEKKAEKQAEAKVDEQAAEEREEPASFLEVSQRPESFKSLDDDDEVSPGRDIGAEDTTPEATPAKALTKVQ